MGGSRVRSLLNLKRTQLLHKWHSSNTRLPIGKEAGARSSTRCSSKQNSLKEFGEVVGVDTSLDFRFEIWIVLQIEPGAYKFWTANGVSLSECGTTTFPFVEFNGISTHKCESFLEGGAEAQRQTGGCSAWLCQSRASVAVGVGCRQSSSSAVRFLQGKLRETSRMFNQWQRR